MSSDRRGSPEAPPPYSGDTQLWAEDMDNYLRRRMQKLEERIQALEASTRMANEYFRSNGAAGSTDQ